MTPEQYLRSKQFKLRVSGGELQTQCPFCGDKNKYGHLYVNREEGVFLCFRCDERGSFAQLQERLGDKPSPAAADAATKFEVWEWFTSLCQDTLLDQPDVIAYLKRERGLSPQTIGKYRIGWAPRDAMDKMLQRFGIGDLRKAGLVSDDNYPLFWDRVMIPYLYQDRIVCLRGKQIGGNVIQAKDTSIRLFGLDNLRGHSEVFICEGEFDAMFLTQQGFPSCAIPGAVSYQEHWNMYFDTARRVFVVLDADTAGRRGAHRIEQLLGRKARNIELPVPFGVESTDITEYFLRDNYQVKDFLEVVDKARGQRIFEIVDALEERDDLLAKSGLALGIPDVDRILLPGLLPGQVMTVLAKTGAGKTAFLTQIMHNLSSWQTFDKKYQGPGVPTLVLSLEQTKAEISERLERIGRLHNVSVGRDDLLHWYSRMRICDENRVPASDVKFLIEDFVEDVGVRPELLIIDYLGYWARGFKGKSRYEQVSEAIMEMKRIAKDNDVAVITPHQVSRMAQRGEKLEMDFARDTGVVEETSDFVIGLFRPGDKRKFHENDDDQDPRALSEVRLEVLKSRHGGTGRQVRMTWAPYSLALISFTNLDLHLGVPTSINHRVTVEWKALEAGLMYDDVVEVFRGMRGV